MNHGVDDDVEPGANLEVSRGRARGADRLLRLGFYLDLCPGLHPELNCEVFCALD